MKVLGLCLLLFLNAGFLDLQTYELEHVRKQYPVAVSDKNVCDKMIQLLSMKPKSSLHLAYLGAYQAINAKHLINPVSKLKAFNKGKENINKAIEASPGDAEIRFLRLSIQYNSPRILGYNADIKADTAYLKENREKISSPVVLKMVGELLNEIETRS